MKRILEIFTIRIPNTIINKLLCIVYNNARGVNFLGDRTWITVENINRTDAMNRRSNCGKII